MEDHYPVDISIRNVDVRLNESKNLTSEMNGESVGSHSVFCSSSDQNRETEVTRFNEESDEDFSVTASDIAEEFREKIHVRCDNSDNCGLLNGCNKLLHDDMRCVDFAMNGLIKCNSVERINACIDQLNHTMCIKKSVDIQPLRTESFVDKEPINTEKSEENSSKEATFINPIVNIPTSEVLFKVPNENEDLYLPSLLLPLSCSSDVNIKYLGYDSESQMPDIMRLIQKDLSEPYSIYTYRYFIHNWPKLCFLAQDGDKCVGAIVCKLDVHKKHSRRGYIAMLAVDENYRKKKIGSNLVLKAINAMVQDNADEVVLETEITNKPALRLYENLGFVRDKRLFRYYLNGVDALRLKLWLR